MEHSVVNFKCGKIISISDNPCVGTMLQIYQQKGTPIFELATKTYTVWKCSACGSEIKFKK